MGLTGLPGPAWPRQGGPKQRWWRFVRRLAQGVPMADPETPAANHGPVIISSSSSERAPIIYFDGASCFGHHNGAIQIELAANLLMPVGAAVRVDVVQTAHLRCSVAAALALREALEKALAMYKMGQQQPTAEEIPMVKN